MTQDKRAGDRFAPMTFDFFYQVAALGDVR
jgi:hypothetical protein